MKVFGAILFGLVFIGLIAGMGFYVHTQSENSELGGDLASGRVNIPDIPGLDRKSPPDNSLDEVGLNDDEREVFNRASDSNESASPLAVVFETAQSVSSALILTKPQRGHIYACGFKSMEESLSKPWLSQNGTITFANKPSVEGGVRWDGKLEIEMLDLNAILSSRGVPNHSTGIFPIKRSSEAYQFDKNPNRVKSYSLSYALPVPPSQLKTPGCLPLGAIGVMNTGAVLYSALDANLRDALAHEVLDECEGHPQQGGQYHYHGHSTCFKSGAEDEHSPRVGYALDGFGIYGPRDDSGNIVTNEQLDECHGHIHGLDSSDISDYHYHINNEFPYTLGCFRGAVDEKHLSSTILPIDNTDEANLRSHILKLPPPAPGAPLPRPEGTSDEEPEDL